MKRWTANLDVIRGKFSESLFTSRPAHAINWPMSMRNSDRHVIIDEYLARSLTGFPILRFVT